MARKRKKNTAAAPPPPVDAPDSALEAGSSPAGVEPDEVQSDEVQSDEVQPDEQSDEQLAEPRTGAPVGADAHDNPDPVDPAVPQESEAVVVPVVPLIADQGEPGPVTEKAPGQPEPAGAADPVPEASGQQAAEEPEPVAAADPVPEASGRQAAEEPEPVAAMDHEPAPVVAVAGELAPSEPELSEEPEPPAPAVREVPEPPPAESTAAEEADATDDTDERHSAAEAAQAPEPTAEPTAEANLVDGVGTAAYDGGPDTAASDAAQVDDSDPERGPVEGKAAWRRLLLMGRPRSTKANLLGALLAIALGIGIGTQVQLTNQRGLSELSQSDLVRVLDDISLRSSRLDDQIRELEATRDRLKNGTGSTAEALAQAQKRVDTLGILAGTVGAQGPGISLSISDPDKKVSGPLILDLIQELRDAGAEAIDVGGVRVVASSFVGDSGGTILIDGTEISRPILIKAIGDPKTLSSAMTIPGGIVETVRQKGARANVTELGSTEITSIHSGPEPTNATPSP